MGGVKLYSFKALMQPQRDTQIQFNDIKLR